MMVRAVQFDIRRRAGGGWKYRLFWCVLVTLLLGKGCESIMYDLTIELVSNYKHVVETRKYFDFSFDYTSGRFRWLDFYFRFVSESLECASAGDGLGL